MSGLIVDTNVPLTANRYPGDKASHCPARCVRQLGPILTGETKFVIDTGWRIIREYMHKLRSERAGIGDQFLQHVLTNHTNPKLCDKVEITPKSEGDGSTGENYEEFPQSEATINFDWPDRKFVAVANVHPSRPPILQASDSKWLGWYPALRAAGVRVRFICHDEAVATYALKMGKPAPPVEECDRE
jgi:hypothetical protein